MLVTTKGQYAMRLMADVARYGEEQPVSLRSVSEREGLSLKYLEQLARPLVKANLLKSVRGNRQVDTDNPEGTYDGLKKYGQDLVELRR